MIPTFLRSYGLIVTAGYAPRRAQIRMTIRSQLQFAGASNKQFVGQYKSLWKLMSGGRGNIRFQRERHS